MGSPLKSPYISIVVGSRNDTRDGDMRKRMQTTLNSFIAQTERYRLRSEFIIVDYNPPPDRPLLKDVLALPKQTEYCTVRTVVVAPQLHRRYRDWDKRGYNVTVAQNVGLRRARGEFVLSTNSDILFSGELIEFIARGGLQKDRLYRVDRMDVSKKVEETTSVEELIVACPKNVTWIYTRSGSIPVIRRKKNHLRSGNLAFSPTGLPMLHVNAAGDFLLMAKEVWHSLRGYPETYIIALHLDGLLCYMAYFGGIKEEILPEECCIYHMEHSSWWKSARTHLYERIIFYLFPDKFSLDLKVWLFEHLKSPLMDFLEKLRLFPNLSLSVEPMLDAQGISYLKRADYIKMMHDMKDGKRAIIVNDENWGLGNEYLEEHFIVKAGWDK